MAEKSQNEKVRPLIYPQELPLEESYVFRIFLPEPIEKSNLEILLGNKPVAGFTILGPNLIYARTPKADPGSQDLDIRIGKQLILHVENAVIRSPKATPFKPDKPGKGKIPKSPDARTEKVPGQYGPASNWWMIHQDLQHTSNARGVRFRNLIPLWRREFEGFFDLTQPIFAPDLVLVGCGAGGGAAFAALDIATGEPVWIRWKEDNGNRFVLGTPVAIDGKVTFVEESLVDHHAQVTCLDFFTGELLWSQPLQVTWSHTSLAAAFDLIYGASMSGHVFALDAETGEMRWEQPIEIGPGALMSSPAVMFGSVYIGTKSGLHVFDALAGNPGWNASSPNNGTATPSIVTAVSVGDPAVVAIGAEGNSLYGYHAGSGQELWRFNGDCSIHYSTPASSEDGKYYLRQWKTIVSIDVQSGNVVQESQNFEELVISGPTLTKDGILIVVDSDQGHQLTLLDRETMSILDKKPVDNVHRGDHGSPSVVGPYVFICDSIMQMGEVGKASVRCFKGGR